MALIDSPTDDSPANKTDAARLSNAKTHAVWWTGDLAVLFYLAAATVLVHLVTGRQYGFHRDELATLDDARHLAWGYVAYPPITPLFGRLSLILFGTSLTGFRFFAALAQAVTVVLAGLMARELGGRRGAQLVAAVAAVPFCLAAGALMQYVSFDCLFWVLAAYLVVRLLKSDDPRWWLAIGVTLGLGMMAKYTMGFFVTGIVVGVVATRARKYLASKWLWMGVALSIVIFLPNVIWQMQHHFVSLDFLHDIHVRDVRIGRTKSFLPDQVRITLLACPLWIAGLYSYLIAPAGRRFRMLGWMYVVPLVLFVIAKGRGYYLGAAYPMLYAGGAVWGEEWLRRWRQEGGPSAAKAAPNKSDSTARLEAAPLQGESEARVDDRPRGRITWVVRGLVWIALATNVVIFSALFLPIAPIKSALWRRAVKVQGDYREEVGWPELTETVARIRDSLPMEDRARLGILAGNYGEAGAIDLYGPAYGLPRAISGINSYWERGYGDPPPETLIVIGISREFLERNFADCRVAGHTWNTYSIENEETRDHPDIYVCGGLRESWPEFWREFQYFG